MKHYLLIIITLIGLTVSCQNSPRFVNHQRPEWTVDFTPFEDVGCPPDEYGRRRCAPGSPLADLGCYEIEEPSDLLGALEPSYPIALCVVVPSRQSDSPGLAIERMRDEGNYIYWIGGLDPYFYRYVIMDGTEFKLLQTAEEFRDVFAPVETAEEALSYALALSNRRAYYDLAFDPQLEYFVDEIEDTHVEPHEDGYLVHLFSYQVFGCGPHYTLAVDVPVTTRGDLGDIERTQIFKDPSEDDLCVD